MHLAPARSASPQRRFGQGRAQLLRANFRRSWTLIERNKVFAIFRTVQVSVGTCVGMECRTGTGFNSDPSASCALKLK